ncbi:MAG: iron-containing alcohol dehydrogenase [Spirochaetia bacterium]|nr:iron-containing alcohol dehydrogenase [Spirochaetia bacterium]
MYQQIASAYFPSQVFFGFGSIASLSNILGSRRSRNNLLVTDAAVADTQFGQEVRQLLESHSDQFFLVLAPPGEPTRAQIETLHQQVEGLPCSHIIALGGGSSIDAAKLLAVLSGSPLTLDDLLGGNVQISGKLPLTAIPTTAGTGSEATPNAIVTLPERQVKQGIVHPYLVPDYVVLDPDATRTLPKHVAASTGIDALAHVMECFLSRKANPVSDTFAARGISLVFSSLLRAYNDPDDQEARSSMLLASFMGGSAIASSGTTAVHALAYPLGGRFNIPHGLANALLLAPVCFFNQDAMMPRLKEIDRMLASGGDDTPVLERLTLLVRSLNIPSRLRQLEIPEEALVSLARDAAAITRLLDNNPKPIGEADILGIYESIW